MRKLGSLSLILSEWGEGWGSSVEDCIREITEARFLNTMV
jgi:hypothetical protein